MLKNGTSRIATTLILTLLMLGTISSTIPQAFAWGVSTSPQTRNVSPGGTTTFTIYVTGNIAGNPNVQLLVSPPLLGISTSFTANNMPAPFTSSMIVNVDPSKASGSYTLDLWAHPQGALFPGPDNRAIGVQVIVGPVGPVFDFNLAVSPPALSVVQGAVANYRVILTYSDPSYSGTPITVDVTGLGPGMNYQLDSSGNLAVSTSTSTPAGTYPFKVTGSALGVYHQTIGTLTVTAKPSPFDYSITVSPSTQTITLGQTTSYTVTVSVVSGLGNVLLSLTGLPSDIPYLLTTPGGVPPYSSTLNIDTSASTSTGTFTIYVTGTGDSLTKTAKTSLTVKSVADFTISGSPQTASIDQGESASFTVFVESTGGFDQPVVLTAIGLPTGASPSFSPASGKPPFSATLTISTTASTPAGSYQVTIDASGGGNTHSAIFSLILNEKATETTPSPSEGPKFDLSTLLNNPLYLLMLIIIILLVAILIMSIARRRRKSAYQQSQTTTKYCSNCGAPLTPGQPFCSSCGQRT